VKGFQVTCLVLCLTLFTGCATSPQDNRNDVSSDAALEAYTRLGLQYLQARDTANARASVQRALEINNDYAPAYNALGLIFQFEDETQLAEQYYKDAIRLDRDSAMFHNNYGAFLYAQKRYREACNELEKATSDPFYTGRGRAFENLGRCYNQIGENVKALDAFERSLKTGSSSSD
jgi:type IV pilus assembly protein PilF